MFPLLGRVDALFSNPIYTGLAGLFGLSAWCIDLLVDNALLGKKKKGGIQMRRKCLIYVVLLLAVLMLAGCGSSGSGSSGSSNSGNIGEGGYEMPNESDASFSDYVQRVDPDLWNDMQDRFDSLE